MEKLFADDEGQLQQIDPKWNEADMLAQEGIFFLKDVVKVLGADALKIKRKAGQIADEGKDTYAVMGIRKVWNHWLVRMAVFGPYYRKHLKSRIKRVPKDMDGNTLLQQKGLYRMSEVCRVLPFNVHQIRYQAKKNPNAKQEYGVFKDPKERLFVVDMEVFAKWVAILWRPS